MTLKADGNRPDLRSVLRISAAVLNGGNGEFPLLMEAWIHNGVRKWMPWEDFSKYAALGGPDD